MYCQKCGTPVDTSLKYCKNCGARLKKEKDRDSTGAILDNLLTTLFLVVMFGLGILVGLVAVLLDRSLPQQVVVVIVLGYLAAVFGICYMLASQVKKVIDVRFERPFEDIAASHSSRHELRAPDTAQLTEYREPAISVTEHTTRTLDEVPVKSR